jgi:hypothetical protein
MAKLRTVRLELLTSKEVAQYLKESDLAILPVGCVEMHGPIIPLGCDLFEDWGAAVLVAEKWGCCVLPPVPYVYPGASGPWPGTIDVSPEASIAYVKEVARAALKAGFKRLVLSGSHGPFGFMAQVVIRAIHQETGNVVAYLSPYGPITRALQEEFGRGGEDLLVLGALKVLGLHGLFNPEVKLDAEAEFPFPTIGPLSQAGVRVPWVFNKDSQHTGIHSGVKLEDADRVIACMRKAIDQMTDVPELFAKYQREMAEQAADPPWRRDDVWSV